MAKIKHEKMIFILSFCFTKTTYSQIKHNKSSYNIERIQGPAAGFEKNKGQMKNQFWNPQPDVLCFGTSEGMNYYIKNAGMSYQLNRLESWKDKADITHSLKEINGECKQVPNQIGTYRMDTDWLYANPSFQVVKGKELDGLNTYYNAAEGVEPSLFV